MNICTTSGRLYTCRPVRRKIMQFAKISLPLKTRVRQAAITDIINGDGTVTAYGQALARAMASATQHSRAPTLPKKKKNGKRRTRVFASTVDKALRHPKHVGCKSVSHGMRQPGNVRPTLTLFQNYSTRTSSFRFLPAPSSNSLLSTRSSSSTIFPSSATFALFT